MSIYNATVPQLTKMLEAMGKWLHMADEHAKANKFDVQVLVDARLAPDQYPLLRQVQAACDSAKLAAARLAGKEAPKHADDEKTFEELLARVDKVVTYLKTFEAKDFEGSSARLIELPFLEGKVLSAGDYLNEMALPNFYFHLTTAYAILRHNGVALGKHDFISSLNVRDK